MRNQILVVLIFVVSLVFTGCGGDPRVTGRVYYTDDNAPVTRGVVMFVKDGYTGRTQIGKDGSYSVHTEEKGHGIP